MKLTCLKYVQKRCSHPSSYRFCPH